MKILVRNADRVVIYAGDDLVLSEAEARGHGWRDPNFNIANTTLTDADLPAQWAGGVWTYTGGVWAVHDVARHNDLVGAARLPALSTIDADTDAIYGAVLGNRAEEYTLAATEAQAYKAAGYTGTVPGSVQSWATAKSWTATQAADDILLTASQWVGAQSAIRAQRLLRKEQVRTATDAAGITAALTAWAGFVAYMRGQLGI